MVHKPHITNLIYALLLIILSLFGFVARLIAEGDFQVTPLIPGFFGVILLFLVPGIKKQNKVLSHIAVQLTSIMLVIGIVMLTRDISSGQGFSRRTAIFSVIVVSSILVVTLYFIRFLKVRRENG